MSEKKLSLHFLRYTLLTLINLGIDLDEGVRRRHFTRRTIKEISGANFDFSICFH